MRWFFSFLYSQFFVTLPKPTKDFTGQTIIVTGSNTGLGLEAARHISRLNASLIIMAVRNLSKGEAAKEDILQSTNRPSNSIEVWELDLQSHDSIKAFAVKVNKLKRLDGILENAGMMTQRFNIIEGYETTITTNVIGTFLLALLILPKLKESAFEFNIQPRVSVVSSDLHFLAKFPERQTEDIFEALNDKGRADMSMERYAVSKLLQVLVVRELASLISNSKMESPKIIINCLTPGACKSDFDRESAGIGKLMHNIVARIISRTTEAGSRALVSGIAAGEESHGNYMENCHVTDASPWVLSREGQEVQRRVWSQLMEELEAIQPGMSKNVLS